jgi:hypothetical protein
MAAGPALLIGDDLTESIREGFKRLDLVRTYQVITTSRTDSSFTALSAPGLPPLGNKVIASGQVLWVDQRRPFRVDYPQTGKKWHVQVNYTNYTQNFFRDQNGNPVTEPSQSVKTVERTFQEFYENVSNARLRSITAGGPHGTASAVSATIPPWLTIQQTKRGPMTNSAGVPQRLERSTYRKVITVGGYVNAWNNAWDTYINTINSDSVTITQRDSQGIKYQETFAPETLLMNDVVRSDFWVDARLYFNLRFVMVYNPATWVRSVEDKGTKRYVSTDAYKPDGTKYVQADLDALGIENDWGYQEITTDNGTVALGEPVRFNGYGAEAPTLKAATYDGNIPFFLNYDDYEKKAFSALNL